MRRPLLHQLNAKPVSSSYGRQRSVEVVNRHRRAGATICVIANGKGGSGKSTLAMNMAIGYGWRRKSVLIVDADVEQKTVVKWPRPAEPSNPVVVCWPTVAILDNLAQRIEDYDVVLIDLAGRDDRAVAQVLDVADIVISPAKPSHQDLSELGRFIRAANAKNVAHLVVFNEATREVTAEIGQLEQQFADFAPFLPTAIQQLAAYRRVYAFGRGVLEIRGPDAARENFTRVFAQLAAAVDDARGASGMTS